MNNMWYPYNSMPMATQPFGQPMMCNGFNTPVQQNIQSPMQAQPQITNTNKIFVSGIEDVKNRILAPNSDYLFVDNDKDLLYQKKTTADGRYEIKTFAITEYKPENSNESNSSVDLSAYVKKDDFDLLSLQLKAIKQELEEYKSRIGANKNVGAGTSTINRISEIKD